MSNAVISVERKLFTVALVGNPNCGKTSVFNGLVGGRAHVGNYPGVTVEKRSAKVKREGIEIEFVDLPGCYSLSAATLDERITRKFILFNKPDLVINVLDAGNLERNLFLTTQVMEMGARLVVNLNMWDEAEKQGIHIDESKISAKTGAPVAKTVGHKGIGVRDLLNLVTRLLKEQVSGHHVPRITYGREIDQEIAEIASRVAQTSCNTLPPRWYAVNLLEDSVNLNDFAHPTPEEHSLIMSQVVVAKNRISQYLKTDSESAVNEKRFQYIEELIRSSVTGEQSDRMKFSNKLDSLLTHRFLGYPIFLFFMWLIFQATYVIGQYPADWIGQGVSLLQGWMTAILPAGWVTSLVADGMIGGMGSVLVFLPNIMILYLGIAFMEDTGYMSRAAFMMDRFTRVLGLNGKSFIPLLMGFGCNVPAIMATRTLESNRDRILSVLLIPFMSCSARLSVYVLFCGAFFPNNAGNVIFSLYLLGILVAVGLGYILKDSLFKQIATPFFMEFPPYRKPTFKTGLLHMWERARVYLKKIGGVILIASIVIWFLGNYPKVESYSQNYPAQIEQLQKSDLPGAHQQVVQLERKMAVEDIEHSFIGRFGSMIGPTLDPLGFNWQMGIALVTGFVAKEVVVSTLGVLYQLGEDVDENSSSLINAIASPSNGITPLAAFAFLVFVLLYTPCVSVIAVMRREIGAKWTWFGVVLQFVIPWIAACCIFQGGRLFGLG